ncbi:MAG: TM2 domain-containing protein [Clostridia bacterium]|nr:TM2 domain-containing protein [Clostridia bacterium]MDY5555884.1 TM2 domain-containing protein [Blautia sp.]
MSKGQALKKAIITVCFGFFGVHQFMDHKIGMGILYLLTFGLFGFGWIVDAFIAVAECVDVFRRKKQPEQKEQKNP